MGPPRRSPARGTGAGPLGSHLRGFRYIAARFKIGARIGQRYDVLYEIYWEASAVVYPLNTLPDVATALAVAKGLKVVKSIRTAFGKRTDVIGNED